MDLNPDHLPKDMLYADMAVQFIQKRYGLKQDLCAELLDGIEVFDGPENITTAIKLLSHGMHYLYKFTNVIDLIHCEFDPILKECYDRISDDSDDEEKRDIVRTLVDIAFDSIGTPIDEKVTVDEKCDIVVTEIIHGIKVIRYTAKDDEESEYVICTPPYNYFVLMDITKIAENSIPEKFNDISAFSYDVLMSTAAITKTSSEKYAHDVITTDLKVTILSEDSFVSAASLIKVIKDTNFNNSEFDYYDDYDILEDYDDDDNEDYDDDDDDIEDEDDEESFDLSMRLIASYFTDCKEFPDQMFLMNSENNPILNNHDALCDKCIVLRDKAFEYHKKCDSLDDLYYFKTSDLEGMGTHPLRIIYSYYVLNIVECIDDMEYSDCSQDELIRCMDDLHALNISCTELFVILWNEWKKHNSFDYLEDYVSITADKFDTTVKE